MICRYWRGWTTPENADAYHQLLAGTIMPEISGRKIPGMKKYQLMRRDAGDEVEFGTLIWFDTLASIKGFVGEDIERANLPDAARAVLKRWDERVQHFEIFDQKEIS